MNIQSWMVKSWASLEWYLPAEAEPLPDFRHAGTGLRDDGRLSGVRAGDTVWVAHHEHGYAGLAWEWVEVKPGIVMLADPNSIITNLQIVDNRLHQVTGLLLTIAINRLVHALPWQQAVCATWQPQQQQPEPAHAVAAAHAALCRPITGRLTSGSVRHIGHSQEAAAPEAPPQWRAHSAASHGAITAATRGQRTRDSDGAHETGQAAGNENLGPACNLRRAA